MLAVIDVRTDTWVGQRDRLMPTPMFNTGARCQRSPAQVCIGGPDVASL